jgi:DNA end-binding protein Ku
MPSSRPVKKKEEKSSAEPRESPGRPIWKGSIAFGLVNVPISLYSMEKKGGELSFKLLDKRNHKGVKYKRVNEDTGEEVPWDQIVKGYEYSDGKYVVLSDEDFEKVQVEATQTIEITDFVMRDEIDDTFFDKPYMIVPGKKAEKGYVLLREALKRSGKVGISKVVMRTKEYLAAVDPKADALVLVLMRFPHELKKVDDFNLPREAPTEYKVTEKEVKLAEQLVASMSSKWKPEQYKDEYYDNLKAWIEAKAEKGDMAAVSRNEDKRAEVAGVIDLAELLRKSMREPIKESKGRKRAS